MTTNQALTDDDAMLALLRQRTVQDLWSSMVSTRMRKMVTVVLKEQVSLTLVVAHHGRVHNSTSLVFESSTVAQLMRFQLGTGQDHLDGIEEELNRSDRLLLPSICRSTLKKVLRHFVALQQVRLVLCVGGDVFEQGNLVTLLRAWAPRIVTLSCWIKVYQRVDNGVAVSQLTELWPVINSMESLRNLTLEVQQFGHESARIFGGPSQEPYQVNLTVIARLQYFGFGSRDNSTCVLTSLISAQGSPRLNTIRYGVPLITDKIGTLTHQLNPLVTGVKMTQLAMIVEDVQDIQRCNQFVQLDSLVMRSTTINVIDLLHHAQTIRLDSLNEMVISSRPDGQETLDLRQLQVRTSLATVKYLFLGFYYGFSSLLDLACLVELFPSLVVLEIGIWSESPAANRLVRDQLNRNNLVQVLATSGLANSISLKLVVVGCTNGVRISCTIEQLQLYADTEAAAMRINLQ